MKAMRPVSVIVEKNEFAGFAREYFSRSATLRLLFSSNVVLAVKFANSARATATSERFRDLFCTRTN